MFAEGNVAVRDRWKGYFEYLMNGKMEGKATVRYLGIEASRSCPQGEGGTERREIRKTLERLRVSKVPVADSVATRMLKYGGIDTVGWMFCLAN